MNLNTFDATYHGLLKDVLENGRYRMDRTGTGCHSVVGRMMRFDLSKGYFPLITTKFVPMKAVVAELLWFLSGSTNNIDLENLGTTIWREWALTKDDFSLTLKEREELLKESNRELYQQYMVDNRLLPGTVVVVDDAGNEFDVPPPPVSQVRDGYLDKLGLPNKKGTNLQIGDLGPCYSAMWRRFPVNSDTAITHIDQRTGPLPGPVEYPEHLANAAELASEYSGDLNPIQDNAGMPFRIIRNEGAVSGKNTTYLIQFIKTKYAMRVTRPQIKSASKIIDPYHPILFGVASVGVPKSTVNRGTYTLWYNMLARCYNEANQAYSLYGGAGIYVSPRWLCFENFVEDIRSLPNYENWAIQSDKFNLDKDYYGAKCYDKSTCLFLTREMNIELSKDVRHLKVTDPKGNTQLFFTRKDAVESTGVSDETFRNYENNKYDKSKLDGWVIENYTPPAGKLLRRVVYVDQIKELIEGLIEKPFSRRHIVSSWAPHLLPDESKSAAENVFNGKQALPPCHNLFQFHVDDLTPYERHNYYVAKNPDYRKLGVCPRHVMDAAGIPTKRLSCMLTMRSNDLFLGAPFNIASYALLTMMVAQVVGMVPGELVYSIGNAHIYSNHMDQVNLQLSRDSKELPIVKLNPEVKDIFAFTADDVIVQFYDSHPAIKGEVAV